jgi:hypothetical protein
LKTNLTEFDYGPGGKWDCGHLNLTAETPLGQLVWKEVIPGPRHSEDSRELTVTLNGVELAVWDDDIPLDFEPPGKPGKWADQFAASESEVAETLEAWYEGNEELLRKLVCEKASESL